MLQMACSILLLNCEWRSEEGGEREGKGSGEGGRGGGKGKGGTLGQVHVLAHTTSVQTFNHTCPFILLSSPPLLLPLSLFPFSLLPSFSLLETVFIEILLLETFLLIKTKMERCLQKLLTLDCQGELIMASCWHTLVQNLVLWMRLIKRMLLFVLARN